MKLNKTFDIIMDYIDNHIHDDSESIKKGIATTIGWSSVQFATAFHMLTDNTLFHYISKRKMYFAGIDLRKQKGFRVCDIALNYGYSEHSAFTRAMKIFCKCTPENVKNGSVDIPNEKYHFADFIGNENIHTQRGAISMRDVEAFETAIQEYHFDIDTCYIIADAATRLRIPIETLLYECFQVQVDVMSSKDYMRPEIETAIIYDISSKEELQKICEYYNCQHYDLDEWMVFEYHCTQKTA